MQVIKISGPLNAGVKFCRGWKALDGDEKKQKYVRDSFQMQEKLVLLLFPENDAKNVSATEDGVVIGDLPLRPVADGSNQYYYYQLVFNFPSDFRLNQHIRHTYYSQQGFGYS